jgi:ubiquinone/menaquinone biosynthesis C-methylase UbiE
VPHDHHFDPQQLAQMEEFRRSIFPPEEALQHFIVRSDMVIADIGCGPGFYTVEAARMLPAGTVYAIDKQEDMIDWTQRRAREASLTNVTTILASAESIPLPSESLDAILMANVLHDVPEQVHILREVQRLLKPGGVYFLIEWDKIATDFGPPLEIRFRPSDLRDTLLEHHFNPVRQIPAPQPWFQVLAIKPALQ